MWSTSQIRLTHSIDSNLSRSLSLSHTRTHTHNTFPYHFIAFFSLASITIWTHIHIWHLCIYMTYIYIYMLLSAGREQEWELRIEKMEEKSVKRWILKFITERKYEGIRQWLSKLFTEVCAREVLIHSMTQWVSRKVFNLPHPQLWLLCALLLLSEKCWGRK